MACAKTIEKILENIPDMIIDQVVSNIKRGMDQERICELAGISDLSVKAIEAKYRLLCKYFGRAYEIH